MWKLIAMLLCSLFLLGCTNGTGNHYEIRDDGVYYYHAIEEGFYEKIEDADEASFKDLGCGYGKDKNQVYYANKTINKIDGANPNTFKWIDCKYYSKDAEYVYYTTHRMHNSDPDSFKVLNSRYSKDKNNVYYLGNLVTGADPSTINFFDDNAINHAKDSSNVYFEDKILHDADPDSFIVISSSSSYAKDDENVYCSEELLHWIDAPTFELLGHYYYSKDKNHIYFFNRTVEGADPKSFEIIDVELSFHGEIDGKDKNNLYYRGEKMEGIDAGSYESLDYDEYVRDENGIYYSRKNDANEVTKVDFLEENDGVFEFVDGYRREGGGNDWFLKTDKAVYLWGYLLKGIDADSFVSLNDFYSKDKNRVYTGFKLDLSNKVTFIPLEGADPTSFEILEVPRFDYEIYGKDKNNVFYKGEKVAIEGIDLNTLQVVDGRAYMKDTNRVYCKDRDDITGTWNVLSGADPITFEPEVDGTRNSRDKNAYYIYCHKMRDLSI